MSGLSEEPKNSRGRAELVFMVLLVMPASGETGLICHRPAETNRDNLPAVRSTVGSPVYMQPLPLYLIHKKYPKHVLAEHVQACHSLSNS